MGLIETACVELAKKRLLPNFDQDHAKVFCVLYKNKPLTINEIEDLTWVEQEKILEIIRELKKLNIVSREDDCYCIQDPLSAIDLLISLAEAGTPEKISAKEHLIAALR